MRDKLLFVALFPLTFSFAGTAIAQSTLPPPAVTTLPMPKPTRPESIQDTGLYGYWTHMTDQDRAGGALLGRVVITGEMLPWEPILVTVSCKGITVYTTQTDSKGDFGVVPSRFPGAPSLQGDTQRQMQTHYEGCVVQAFLTGFQSSTITLTQRNLRDNPLVGTVTLSRDMQARGTAVSPTSKSAPPDAVKHWARAGAEMLAQKPDRARHELEKAVQSYAVFADAWYQLGILQMWSSPRDARTCFDKALAADPTFVLPHELLASLAIQNEDWLGALDQTGRSLQLDPGGSMRIWYYRALANYQLGNIDAAQASAVKSLAMDPLHNVRNTEQLLAAILARKTDYAGALAHLRNCLTYIPEGPNANLLKEQIEQLEHRVAATN